MPKNLTIFHLAHVMAIHLLRNVPSFFIGGSVVDYIDSLPRLGYIISNTSDVRQDIINRRKTLCMQINNVLCYFKSKSIIIKMKLLRSYCTSYYGEL